MNQRSVFDVSTHINKASHQRFKIFIQIKMAHELSDASFSEEVIASGKVALVDLWAEWCGPCRAMTPIIDELHKEYGERAVIGKLNVDDNPEIPTNYSVRGIPTFLLFKNGELKAKIVGMQPKQALKEQLDALLA